MLIMAPMSTDWYTSVPTYIDGNIIFIILSIGFDTEGIQSSSAIAKAKWARLAWQQPSALGEGERLIPGEPANDWGGDEKLPPPLPPLSMILNNSKTAAQSVAVFDIPSGASIGQVWWKFERDRYEIFELLVYRFFDVTAGRYRSERC